MENAKPKISLYAAGMELITIFACYTAGLAKADFQKYNKIQHYHESDLKIKNLS